MNNPITLYMYKRILQDRLENEGYYAYCSYYPIEQEMRVHVTNLKTKANNYYPLLIRDGDFTEETINAIVNWAKKELFTPSEPEKQFDRDTALAVLKEFSRDMYPSYDLFGNPTLVINRDKFEEIRKKYLDKEK